MNRNPKHPPRLTPFQKFGNPLWFVTFGTQNRRAILANEKIHDGFIHFAGKQAERGIAIGRYVIMPDHIHLFIRLAPEFKLGATIGFLKKALSNTLTETQHSSPHWQPSFFDHMLRSAASYSAKWEYVFQNPVRAGLVKAADKWPYSGEIAPLRF
jgi:putative transposase